MPIQYEYKFVRLGEGWVSVNKKAEAEYQSAIHDHASEGWRLVQVFAPGTGMHGRPTFYELIFERQANTDS
jgi:hypothetical protein